MWRDIRIATVYAGARDVRSEYSSSLLIPAWTMLDVSGYWTWCSFQTSAIAEKERMASQRVGVFSADRRCWNAWGIYQVELRLTSRKCHRDETYREYIIECLKGIPVISCQVIPSKVFEIRHWKKFDNKLKHISDELILASHKLTGLQKRARSIIRHVDDHLVSTSRSNWTSSPKCFIASSEKHCRRIDDARI